MKRLIVLFAALLLASLWTADVFAASVRGYYRQDGTYVQPHLRTNPDGNPLNNYGFPGNYNPNTGQITPGNPQSYQDWYDRGQGGLGGWGTYQTPYGR